MGKGADMSWEDIQNEFDIMNRMSCRPVGLQKVPGNHIFDEDQSVKWNREQVELNNKKARIAESAIKVSTVKAPHTYMKAVGTRELEKILEEELGNEDTK